MKRDDETTTTRSEEELIVDHVREPAGTVEVHKRVDTFTVEEEAPRRIESLGEVERGEVFEDDSGEVEILEDGSVSIPILEERLVVSRQLVVRERVTVRKVTETQVERIRAELRRERIEIQDDDELLTEDARSSVSKE